MEGLKFHICVNSKADGFYRYDVVKVVEIDRINQEVRVNKCPLINKMLLIYQYYNFKILFLFIRLFHFGKVAVTDSKNQRKIFKKEIKKRSLHIWKPIAKYFKVDDKHIAYCDLERTQINLMYDLVYTMLSLQGTTIRTVGVIDNTRSMSLAALFSAFSRFQWVEDVMLLHPINSLDDLKRDCKVDLRALKYDSFLRNRFIDENRQKLGITKYIIKNDKFEPLVNNLFTN